MTMKYRPLLLVLATFAETGLIVGCLDAGQSGAGHHHVASTRPAIAATASDSANATAKTGGSDDASQLPIDCPLRKQGIDPSHLRPFAEVEKYIKFLDRSDRAAWQKPDAVVTALGLKGSETVIDVGAGSGYFTFRLANALPTGRVVAADTEAEMIRHIYHKAMAEDVQNVEAKLIQPGDPAISAQADLVFMCDVLHHVADRSAWLSKLASEMKPGARLVLIEFKEGKLPEGPPEAVKIPRSRMLEMVTQSGLRLASERSDLLPYQTFLVFRKPE